MSVLPKEFFRQKTQIAAEELLGKVLVHTIDNQKISGMIVETEAYVGPHDLACHASRGKTERNKVMFEDAGVWYIYLIYGMYYNLNIITESENYPSGILIRAVEPIDGIEIMKTYRRARTVFQLTNGPGKLCQAMNIDKSLNGTSAVSKDAKLYFEDRGINVSKNLIIKTKRIGIEYAGAWEAEPLRFYIKDNKFVSKK